MSQKKDLRVRRTHKLLQQAFIELVVEDGFEAMTVQTLAECAMINRATFYRHFEDKYDLAQKVYEAVTSEYVAAAHQAELEDANAAWRLLFEHIGKYANFYLAMLNGMPRFREQMRTRIEQQMHAELLKSGLDESKVALPLPVILRYLASAQMGILQWWLEEKQPISATEMSQYLLQLDVQGGIQALNLPDVPYGK